jgi:methionyl-tRNA formyltransferase
MKRAVVIGNGKMAIDCLSIMQESPDLAVSLVITEPQTTSLSSMLALYCAQHGIPCVETMQINSQQVVEQLQTIKPDFIFNINSARIIKQPLLSLPSVQIINFHNGPLPKYGGVNACSWAIINGEETHGATWHFVDEGIDTGPIIAQSTFEIPEGATAIRLIMHSINEGVRLFRELLPDLLAGTIEAQAQKTVEATYHSLKDVPNGGIVDFTWTYQELDRFVRGLTFHPMVNAFVYPTTSYAGRKFHIQQVVRLLETTPGRICGQIMSLASGIIGVQVGDCIVGIVQVLNDEQNRIKVEELVVDYGLEEGSILGIDLLKETMPAVESMRPHG